MMIFSGSGRRSQAGYTLVELMVAVALTGIVTVSIYKGYVSVSTGYDVQEQVVEVQQNARVGVDRMVRELRLAGCDPDQAGVGSFLQIDDSTIRFTMDLIGGDTDGVDNDGDGITDEADEVLLSDGAIDDLGEDITFSLVGEELQRSDANGTTDTIIDNVNALRFFYYDQNNAITAVAANVRSVQLAVLVRASNEDYGFTDSPLYSVEDLLGNSVDIYVVAGNNLRFRRQLLTAVVRCRNMGL